MDSAITKLQALIATHRVPLLQATSNERRQYWLEPTVAIERLATSNTGQRTTGILALVSELRFFNQQTLQQHGFAETFRCLYAAMIELCEDRTTSQEAFRTLEFYEHSHLLYHVALGSTDYETRFAAVRSLASLRVTDSFPYAQEALRSLGFLCPYGDTREQARSEYEDGTRQYGRGLG